MALRVGYHYSLGRAKRLWVGSAGLWGADTDEILRQELLTAIVTCQR